MPGFEFIGQEEFEQVKEVFEKSKVLFRHGFDNLRNGVYKVREFEEKFAEYMGSSDSLALTSGTAAIKVGLEAYGIGPGDEVITQSFTFVATVEGIVETGAQPVICDVDETLNIDPNDLENRITPQTKAIIVVHMLGVPSQMDKVMEIAKRHNLIVIEDTAWGCGGSFQNQKLGTIGHMGTFSFDFAKTMTTGEGGMLIAKDPEVLERAKAYHDHGHENNPSLPRWEDSRSGSGFNFRMSELQGAVGIAQLKKLDMIVEKQRENKAKIKEAISSLNLSFRKIPIDSYDTSDALVFFVESKEKALSCRQELINNGLGTKILPEAYTWHFAGSWDHIPSLTNRYPDLNEAFKASFDIISKAVALPIMSNMPADIDTKIHKCLSNVIK